MYWTEFIKTLHRNPKIYVAAVIAALLGANAVGHWVSDGVIEAILGILAAAGFYHKPTDPSGATTNPSQSSRKRKRTQSATWKSG